MSVEARGLPQRKGKTEGWRAFLRGRWAVLVERELIHEVLAVLVVENAILNPVRCPCRSGIVLQAA